MMSFSVFACIEAVHTHRPVRIMFQMRSCTSISKKKTEKEALFSVVTHAHCDFCKISNLDLSYHTPSVLRNRNTEYSAQILILTLRSCVSMPCFFFESFRIREYPWFSWFVVCSIFLNGMMSFEAMSSAQSAVRCAANKEEERN